MLKRYLLLSVLLLLVSSVCFSDVTLTEAEFQELEQILTRWGIRLDEQQLTITNLERLLNLAETARKKLEIETETQKMTINVLQKSYDQQEKEAIKTTVIVSLIAALAGLITGLLL